MKDINESLMGMFGFLDIPMWNFETIYYLKSYGTIFLIGCIASTPIATLLVSKLKTYKYPNLIIDVLQPMIIIILLLIITGYLIDGSFNPFLYFRF